MDLALAAFENAPIGLIYSEDRTIRRCNPRFAEIFAGPVEAFADLPLMRLYPSAEDYQKIGAHGLEIMRESGRYDDERIMQRLTGEAFWCRVRGQSLTPEAPFRRSIWSFADLSQARLVVELSRREREVAILTSQGRTSKEIGRTLGISYRTVELYRARLQQKFGARNLADLVAKFSGVPQ